MGVKLLYCDTDDYKLEGGKAHAAHAGEEAQTSGTNHGTATGLFLSVPVLVPTGPATSVIKNKLTQIHAQTPPAVFHNEAHTPSRPHTLRPAGRPRQEGQHLPCSEPSAPQEGQEGARVNVNTRTGRAPEPVLLRHAW